MFAKADTHVENSGAAASPPAATLDKEDAADAEEAVDVRDARDDDDAANDMLDANNLLLTMLLLPKERSDEINEAVIM